MTETKHSHEPWFISDDYEGRAEVASANERRIFDDDHYPECYCSTADARRIVACVNLLRGVPTEELERVMNVEDAQDRLSHLADMGTFLAMTNETTFPPTPAGDCKITDAKIFTEEGVLEVHFDEPIVLHVSEGKTPELHSPFVALITSDDVETIIPLDEFYKRRFHD